MTRIVRLGKPVDDVELNLQRATRVFGRVTTGEEKEPVNDEYVELYQKDSKDDNDYYKLPEAEKLPNPTGSRSAINPRIVRNTRTDEDGRFEFHAGPGGFYLIGPRDVARPAFEISDQEELESNLHAKTEFEGILKGRVVLQSDPGQGVAEVWVSGFAESSDHRYLRVTTDAMGHFEAKRSPSAELIGAFSEDNKLGGIVRAEAGAESIVLPLGPTATLRGTLIDRETGEPAADRDIIASIRVELDHDHASFRSGFPQSDTTDDAGRFEIAGVVPGHLYQLDLVIDRDNNGNPGRARVVGEVKPTEAVTLELHLPRDYRPATIALWITGAFKDQETLPARMAQKLSDAKQANQQVLLVVADPQSSTLRQFFEARYDSAKPNEGLRKAAASYRLLAVDAKQTAFLKDVGVAVPDSDGATLAVLNPDRRVVVEAKIEEFIKAGLLDRVRLTEFLNMR